MKTTIALLIYCCACVVNNENNQHEEDDNNMNVPGFPGNRKKGWSASGPLVHQGQAEVSLQANFEDSPGNYTAQFKLSGDLRNKQVVAEITWSVEGNQNRRIVSVANGTSVQGAGQGVTIKIRDASLFALLPGYATDYIASVTVVKGGRGSTTNPPTYDPGSPVFIPTGNTATIPVPQDAGIISVAVLLSTGIPGTVLPENSVMVAQQDVGGNIQARYDPRQYFWIPLFPGTGDLLINNTSGVTVSVAVIFGIEG